MSEWLAFIHLETPISTCPAQRQSNTKGAMGQAVARIRDEYNRGFDELVPVVPCNVERIDVRWCSEYVTYEGLICSQKSVMPMSTRFSNELLTGRRKFKTFERL